jgi:hypothetical protein
VNKIEVRRGLGNGKYALAEQPNSASSAGAKEDVEFGPVSPNVTIVISNFSLFVPSALKLVTLEAKNLGYLIPN